MNKVKYCRELPPKEGERVFVKSKNDSYWRDRIFINQYNGKIYTVVALNEDKYLDDEAFDTFPYTEMKIVPEEYIKLKEELEELEKQKEKLLDAMDVIALED